MMKIMIMIMVMAMATGGVSTPQATPAARPGRYQYTETESHAREDGRSGGIFCTDHLLFPPNKNGLNEMRWTSRWDGLMEIKK